MTTMTLYAEHDHGEDLEYILMCNGCRMVVYQANDSFEGVQLDRLVSAQGKHTCSEGALER